MTTLSSPGSRLGEPDQSRLPLRCNAYEFSRIANARLVSMFPYRGPGAIVPCVTFMHGAEGGAGRFFHNNTRDEVGLALGGGGKTPRGIAMGRPGLTFMSGRMHQVRSPLEDDSINREDWADPGSYALAVISQRQSDGGEQRESIIFRCEECNKKLFQFDYEATPDRPENHGGRSDDVYAMDATLWGSYEAARQFNDECAGSPCPKCGASIGRFPLEVWGWEEFVVNHRAVNDARHRLAERGETLRTSRSCE